LSPWAVAVIAFITYSGLVPISPYAMPRVTIIPAKVSFRKEACDEIFPISLKKADKFKGFNYT
jgi:hypothetical protein